MTSPGSPPVPARTGILCVVSGPSGSGKTTLCHRMATEDEGCRYSVSCTTRPPREGEIDGADYRFLSGEAFEAHIAAGDLLEYAEVHDSGRYYGTLKAPVIELLRQGIDVVMDLDVQGAAQLRALADPEISAAFVDIFILPPSLEELRARILGRGPMAESEIALRLHNASREMEHWSRYHYTVVSGSRDADFAQLTAILQAERHRSGRLAFSLPDPRS